MKSTTDHGQDATSGHDVGETEGDHTPNRWPSVGHNGTELRPNLPAGFTTHTRIELDANGDRENLIRPGLTLPQPVTDLIFRPANVQQQFCLPAGQGVFTGSSRISVESVVKGDGFKTSHEDLPEDPKEEHQIVEAVLKR